MTGTPLVEANGLCKRYGNGTEALREFSFSLAAGESLGLLGANGAGKTTTMRLLAGALLPTRGTIALGGSRLTPDASALKRRIGYLPAEDGLYAHLTAFEQLLLSGALYGLDEKTASSRAGELFALLALSGGEHRRVGELSTGTRRKVALACTLLHDPDLLLLDEPLESIDVVTAHAMKTVLRGLAGHGRALIVTSHNLPLVEDLCGRIVVLDAGRPVFDGPIAGLVGPETESPATSRLEAAVLRLLGRPAEAADLSWRAAPGERER